MTHRRFGMRKMMAALTVLATVAAGCGGGTQAPGTTDTAESPPTAIGEPSPTPTVRDIMELEDFAPLEPGTYFIDPDDDPSTPMRVVYEIPVEGWSEWIGAVKFAEDGDGHVGVSITTVTNVVRHGCRDNSPADPPVGLSVDDLATALADLAPFRVTSPPTDVSIYGYRGKHLQLTVPDLPVEESGFTGCIDSNLWSWISPLVDAFYGHTGPGYTEEFWILDVEGTRLMIVAHRSPGSPPEDLAELRAVLDSIRIEP
jgi:hypothetical protein